MSDRDDAARELARLIFVHGPLTPAKASMFPSPEGTDERADAFTALARAYEFINLSDGDDETDAIARELLVHADLAPKAAIARAREFVAACDALKDGRAPAPVSDRMNGRHVGSKNQREIDAFNRAQAARNRIP